MARVLRGLLVAQGLELIRAGKDLIMYITRARVPMPKSTREFIERCERYRALPGPRALPSSTPAPHGDSGAIVSPDA